MSAHAAIAPAAEIRVRRASAVRMVVIAGVYLAIVVPAVVYPLVSPLRTAAELLLWLLWLAVLLGSYSRQPDGRVWKLIFLMMVTQHVTALEYVPNPFVANLARVTGALGVGVVAHFIVTFPTGYFRDRFDRLVVGLSYGLAVAYVLNELFFVGDWVALGCLPECTRNTFVIWPNRELYDWLKNAIVSGFCLVAIPLVMVALWRHWRVAAGGARRTLLPVVVGVPLWLGLGIVEILSGELDFAPGIAFFDRPSGVAIHVIAPVVLPAGLLIGMVRARLSRARVANLVVELGRGVPVGNLRDVLARALGDPSLELAFAAPTGAGYVDASGQPVELPAGDPARTVTRLEREDELLGVLVHDPAIEAEDPGLVEAVGNAAGLALENERLAAEVRAQLEEVRASRARIVEAADAERRRVERDLHDGAQQRLVALAMRLQVAKETTPGAAVLLDEATGELQTAIGEVRGLARGVHPTILTEAGLRAAVEALAERTPVAVTVDIPERRYDPQLEATAYFVVAEALTNVARYADASAARVAAVEDDGLLVVTVADDGRGGADPTVGSGLRGLADRLAAIDGRLAVSSPSAAGTIVRAEMPVHATAALPPTTPSHAAANPSSLARVRAVPENRTTSVGQGRGRLSNPVILIPFLLAALAGAAVAAAVPGLQPSPPEIGRDESFVRPFDYQVPSGSRIRLYPGSLDLATAGPSDRLNVLSAPAAPDGISIWAVQEMIADPCASQGPLAPRKPGRLGMLAYLHAVHGLRVEKETQITIDGRLATQIDVTAENGRSGCPDKLMSLWRDTSARIGQQPAMAVPDGERVRVKIVDVDGATIAIEIWSRDNLDNWLVQANPIVDSIRFFHGSSPGSSPTTPTGWP